LVFDGFLGRAVAVDRNAELSTKLCQAMDVVGMLVGDEDAGQALRRATDGGQARPNLAQAEAGIDEDAGFIGLDIGAIAIGTASENSQTNGHGLR
jgi:hypothetical protein